MSLTAGQLRDALRDVPADTRVFISAAGDYRKAAYHMATKAVRPRQPPGAAKPAFVLSPFGQCYDEVESTGNDVP